MIAVVEVNEYWQPSSQSVSSRNKESYTVLILVIQVIKRATSLWTAALYQQARPPSVYLSGYAFPGIGEFLVLIGTGAPDTQKMRLQHKKHENLTKKSRIHNHHGCHHHPHFY